jgi:hypothetical protein
MLLLRLGGQICSHVHGPVQDGKNGAQNAIVGVALRYLCVEGFESLNQRVEQSWRMLRKIGNFRIL